jgi:hypothetical protein
MRTLPANLVLLSAAAASACPFCGPPQDSPGAAMAGADAAVVGRVIARRLLFAGDDRARVAVEFECVRIVRGGKAGAAPAVGSRFTLVPDNPADAPKDGAAVCVVNSAGRGWKAVGIYPDRDGKLAGYLAGLAEVLDKGAAARVAFLFPRLEGDDARIAEDAHGQFAGVPFGELAGLRDRLPADRLRAWLLSDSVPAGRKGLYAVMLSVAGGPDDAAVLEKALPSAAGSGTGSGGILAAWARLTGRPEAVLTPVIRDGARPTACREGAVRAAGFLYDAGTDADRPALRNVLKAALAEPVLLPYAVEELVRLRDWSLTEDIKAAAGTEAARLAVRKYARALPAPQRAELESWLERREK